jgi:hypothetical protein
MPSSMACGTGSRRLPEWSCPSRCARCSMQNAKPASAMMPTSRVIGGLADLFAPAFLDDAHLTHVLPARMIAWYRTRDGQAFAREVMHGMNGRSPERAREVIASVQARGQRTALHFASNGGRILFGSDTPSAPTYANPPGYNGYLELRELESARHLPKTAAVRRHSGERAFFWPGRLRDNRAGQDREPAHSEKRSARVNRCVRCNRDGHRKRPYPPPRGAFGVRPLMRGARPAIQ